MAGDDSSVAEHLRQLDTARKLVLGDAAYYPQIVQGILPIIGATARLELRRWGADFLSETFASPALPQDQKQTLCLLVLDTLNAMLDVPTQDTQVLKSVIQTAASVYPLVFKHMYVQPAPSRTRRPNSGAPVSLKRNGKHWMPTACPGLWR